MLAFLSIQELRKKLDTKQLSEQELLDYTLKRFAKHDSELKSALELFDRDSILAEACSETLGQLKGIPGLIKDNICQKGRIASAASKTLQNYTSVYDATVISRLKKEGALLVGRANCDEFAMGSSNETSAFQKTANPWDISRVPGGSSGGSAAAVAAGFVPWALGSETGGSVRQPAAFCGIVGFKPTYGLISRYGLIAYASSVDQIGVMARSVFDVATVVSAIAGHDLHDSTSLDVSKKDYTNTLNGSIKPGLRIGVIDNMLNAEGMDAQVKERISDSIKVYEKLGATIKHVNLPTFEYAAAVYFIVSRAEAASNLARYDGVRYGYRDAAAQSLDEMYTSSRYEEFGHEVRRRILIGNYVLSAGHAAEFYDSAKKVQNMMRYELINAFQDVDLIVLPVHAAPAFKLGELNADPLQMDLQDYFTCSANLTGAPAISLPCGFTKEQLPVGFQLMGPHLSEELLFQTAHAYQQHTSWHTMHPPSFKD
ncbi:Asp-tRNA(Asn)/Glu-tRNA(Gln) amidotransferase subunit GatA [Candidatus Babeliales bacterium]|nr:Asp-tRNA(Asn)/Glu-tRNA(Gln) amidotransferase subunit GatA [Candidatus Babeliales bacterium]